MPFWTGCQLPSGNTIGGTRLRPGQVRLGHGPYCVDKVQSRKSPNLRQLKFNEKAWLLKAVDKEDMRKRPFNTVLNEAPTSLMM